MDVSEVEHEKKILELKIIKFIDKEFVYFQEKTGLDIKNIRISVHAINVNEGGKNALPFYITYDIEWNL